MQVWKTKRKRDPFVPKPKQLMNPHELPEELEYLWEWWIESFTGDTLTFTELHHWCELTDKKLEPWEVQLMKTIDRIYWSTRNV